MTLTATEGLNADGRVNPAKEFQRTYIKPKHLFFWEGVFVF